ncbi:MAG: hypothetical protein WC911_03515 [Thermoleophilia bacterium]
MPEDFVTKSECARSHEGLKRENDLSNQNVTTAIDGLTTQIGKLWDVMEVFRTNYRNHVPPWTAAVMTLEALAVGIFASRAFL